MCAPSNSTATAWTTKGAHFRGGFRVPSQSAEGAENKGAQNFDALAEIHCHVLDFEIRAVGVFKGCPGQAHFQGLDSDGSLFTRPFVSNSARAESRD